MTCHWHHARFDVCGGGTLDPWADDVPVHDITVRDGVIWVNPNSRNGNQVQLYKDRLLRGLEQNIGLVIAKAIVGLMEAGVPYLAAHAPTSRETPHTAKIAWRLHRDEKLFEEE